MFCLFVVFFLLVQPNGMTSFFFFFFFIMCFRLQHVNTPPPPPPDCNNQLSPHGGNSDHKWQRQQRNQGEGEPAGCRSDPSMAVVLVPLGPVSFSDSRRLRRVGGRVARGFVVGGGVGPVTWPIIIVPFTVIPAPWAAALLTWNREISDWWMDIKSWFLTRWVSCIKCVTSPLNPECR